MAPITAPETVSTPPSSTMTSASTESEMPRLSGNTLPLRYANNAPAIPATVPAITNAVHWMRLPSMPMASLRDAVGAEPEIGGVAERGETADRHQEMQARGKDHEDRNFRAHRERVVAADQRQRRGHHQEHQNDGDLRENQDAERVQLRYQHRRDKGADDAAETADHDHHKYVDNDPQIQRMVHRVARNLQAAAERREKNPEREHAGEQPLLIDAERGHHVAVLRRRAN